MSNSAANSSVRSSSSAIRSAVLPAADNLERWTSGRRATLCLQILKGEIDEDTAARQYNLTKQDVHGWMTKYLDAGENALRSRPKEEIVTVGAVVESELLIRLRAKVGELVMENDYLKTATGRRPQDE